MSPAVAEHHGWSALALGAARSVTAAAERARPRRCETGAHVVITAELGMTVVFTAPHLVNRARVHQ